MYKTVISISIVILSMVCWQSYCQEQPATMTMGARTFLCFGAIGSVGAAATSWATVANSCKRDEHGNKDGFACAVASVSAAMTTLGAAAHVYSAWQTFGATAMALHADNNTTRVEGKWFTEPSHPRHKELHGLASKAKYYYSTHKHNGVLYDVAVGINNVGKKHIHTVSREDAEDHGININFDDTYPSRFDGLKGDDADKAANFVVGWWRDNDTSASCMNISEQQTKDAMYGIAAGPGEGGINADYICGLGD